MTSSSLLRRAAFGALLPLVVLAGGQGIALATGSPGPATGTAGVNPGNAGGGNASCAEGQIEHLIEDPVAGLTGDGTFAVTLRDVTSTTFAFSANLVVETLIVKGGSVDAVVTRPQSRTGSAQHQWERRATA